MTWTRLSDEFNDRPELLTLSRSARLLHVEALVYGNRLLTDGLIPRAAMHRFSDTVSPDSDIAELVDAGLWEAIPAGWQIRHWAEPPGEGEAQELKDAVLKRQKDNRDKQERYRERERLHRVGDHSKCPKTRPCRTVTGYQTGNATGSVTGSRPNPNPARPEGSGPPGRRCTEHNRSLAADGTGCETCDTQPRPRVVPVPDERAALAEGIATAVGS